MSLFNFLFNDLAGGKIDENKQYYTNDMFKQDVGEFVLVLLLEKGVVTEKEVEEYKKEFMKFKNELFIKEIKNFNKKL